MSKTTTYSFEDVYATFHHTSESVGNKTSKNKGIGLISIISDDERTKYEKSSDGSTIAFRNHCNSGYILIKIQQTSSLYNYLLRWYNYISMSEAKEWIGMTITVIAKGLRKITCSYVSPEKVPDETFEGEGGYVTWKLKALKIIRENY